MPERGAGRRVGPWFLPLLICTALSQTALNLARPVVSYRVVALGGDGVDVGLVTACFAVLPVLVAMPLGRYSDRQAHLRRLLLPGAALFVAGPLLMSLSTDVVTLALASAVLGLAQLVLLVAAQATIARWSVPDDMEVGFGWLTAAVSVGQLVGPVAAGLLLGSAAGDALVSASQVAFWVAAGVALPALPFAVVVAGRTPRQEPAAADRAQPAPTTLALLRRPGVPSGLFASFALLGAADILVAYLPLIAEQRGIAPSVVGLLLGLRAGATLASRLLLERLLARWRSTSLVVASAGGSALAFAVVPVPGVGAAGIAVALVVGGFLLGVGQPITMGMIVRAVPDGARSSGLALRLVGNRVGQVVLPAAAGVVAGAGGAGALWLACGVLAMASASSHRARRA